MRIDPLVTLAFSVQSHNGIYALLLGSGVSRSAGIPTGWEVVLDLIRKLAHIQREEPNPTPEEWFKNKYGAELGYATLLDALTQTPAERNQILKSYFEPNDEDRRQGLKSPMPGHRAIADLMRRGAFRVVLTTNFDRLLEQALRDAGIEPTVISTTDSIKGAEPLTHARCTVIKLHGDYLDHRLKNTPEELKAYEEPMDKLLDRVLDEFGLIVCGWSAQYDLALRAAIERCPNRRYPTYWATRIPASDAVEKLISLRGGTKVPIRDADQFFVSLRANISALDSLQDSDPISQKIAVARVKKSISNSIHLIELHDLLHNETARVFERIYGSEFPVQGVELSAESIAHRMTVYEESCSVLLSMIAVASYWSGPEHHAALLKCLQRLLEDPSPPNGLNVLIDLRRYPALLFLYVMCLSAIAGDRYVLIQKAFDGPIKLGPYKESGQLISVFHQYRVLDHSAQKALPGREREYTPLSNRLFQFLRPFLHEFTPSDHSYQDTFDWFEYLVGLLHCHHRVDWTAYEKKRSGDSSTQLQVWGPLGCFAWRNREDSEWMVRQLEIKDGVLPARLVKVRDIFFPGNNPVGMSRFLSAKEAFDQFVASVASRWW